MSDNHSILIVEDDEGIRDAMGLALSEYHLVFDSTGREALELYKRTAAGLILLDYLLPGLDGLDIQRQLRAYDPNVRTILITAAPVNERDVMDATGIKPVLRKPFHLSQLTDLVETLLYEE